MNNKNFDKELEKMLSNGKTTEEQLGIARYVLEENLNKYYYNGFSKGLKYMVESSSPMFLGAAHDYISGNEKALGVLAGTILFLVIGGYQIKRINNYEKKTELLLKKIKNLEAKLKWIK